MDALPSASKLAVLEHHAAVFARLARAGGISSASDRIPRTHTRIWYAGPGLAVATTTAASVIGGLTLGTVLDRLNQRIASTLAISSQVVALFVMTQTTDAIVLYAACAVFGLSVRNVITFPALIVQREFEAPSFGMLIGLSTAISQFVFAFGPGLIGLVRDWSGGYRAALLLCVALDLVAAAIVLRSPKKRS